MKQNYTFI